MRAAVHRSFGGPDVIHVEDIPTPLPRPDEILIRVHATTVSAADHRSRSRDLPAGLAIPSSLVLGIRRPKRPVLGMDVAGVVAEIGAEVTGFAQGDEVLAMLGSRFGGHADYAIARATDAVIHKPDGLDFAEAVSLVFGGLTAQAFLNQVDVHRGTTVLVNGASGAVGTAVVQLAAAVGARVTGVTSPANQALVAGLGAERTIDYTDHDFATDGSMYDVIVDCVGNAPIRRIRASMNPGGAALLVAADLRSLLTAKRDARKHGITIITSPGAYRAEDLRYVLFLAEQGDIRPTIDRAYSLDEIAAAHRYVDTGRKRGSVIITTTDPHRPTSTQKELHQWN